MEFYPISNYLPIPAPRRVKKDLPKSTFNYII